MATYCIKHDNFFNADLNNMRAEVLAHHRLCMNSSLSIAWRVVNMVWCLFN